jgi:3-deoxy-D-manno-octulosonic-acid transferase
MSSVPVLYRLAIRAARRAAPLLAIGDSKLARGIRGRQESVETLVRWGHRERDPDRQTVWFHAPSEGEGLQAEAVMRAWSALRPGLQTVFTHFSPSAEGLGERIGADVAAYLPWDVEDQVGPVLDALRPALLVFTKTEVWPVLVEAADRRGVPVAIAGATVPDGAGRMRWPARAVLTGTWNRLAAACANSREDADRLVGLGVERARVHVTGDPGVDSAERRATEADFGAPYLEPFRASGRLVVVAGSTWPEDEEVLLEAWVGVRTRVPGALLIVAPHEPTPARVGTLLRRLRASDLATVTLATVERNATVGSVDVVVVDRLGVLARLYRVAQAAYVGGGFGSDGLHSVLEPASAGVPSVFGPRHRNARSAAALLAVGGAQEASDGAALEAVLAGWLTDADEKNGAGRSALDYIEAHGGAARRTAELLDSLIGVAGRHE